MKRALALLAPFCVAFALGQGSVSGTLYAPTVAGLKVIACYPSETGCDEALSGYAVIAQSGPSASYRIDGLGPGPFIVLVWNDVDGDGEATDAELSVYGGSEAQLVRAPAMGIDLTVGTAGPGALQPESATPAAPDPAGTPVGNWYQGSSSTTTYYSPSTGSWAPPSGTGFRYEFRPDGSYTYSGLMQSSMYSCTMAIFNYQTGRWQVQDRVLALEPDLDKMRSEDNCNEQYNYEKDVPLEPQYFLWELDQDDYGTPVLNLSNLVLNAQGELNLDPEYAESGPSVFYRDE